MTVNERIAIALQELSDEDTRQVADYIEFLRFRSRMRGVPALSAAELQQLYSEFDAEDEQFAEAGMADYAAGLHQEDE